MIKKNIFFPILFFLISSCNLPHRESNLHQNYYQKGLKFTLKTAREIEKENNLKLISYGINNSGNIYSPDWNAIHDFSFFYEKFDKVDINKARELIIKLTQEVMNVINNDQNIKNFLYKYPFEVDGLDFSILFSEKNGGKIYGKNILHTVALYDSVIHYRIIPDENSTMQTYEESYEDAVNIVKDNLKTDPIFK
jgi:hypothetical protein